MSQTEEASLRQELDQLGKRIDKLEQVINDTIATTEERISSQEELVAQLMIGYAEMASTLEATIQEVMSPRSEKEKEEFRRALAERYAETLNMIREVANVVEERGSASSAETVLTMAARQQATAPDSERDNASSGERKGPTPH